MGALHAGHERLMVEARSLANSVIVSIFVNPMQFDDLDDLAKYPRTLDDDIEICGRQNIDAIFAPSFDEMYPVNRIQTISAGRIGNLYEGKHRSGHFDGVLTVVDRLFTLTSPDVAIFGQKDFQQLVLVRRMSAERHKNVKIVSVSTVRDPDGLASSSRNTRLTKTDRVVATKLYESLRIVETRYQAGITDARQLETSCHDFLNQFEHISLDYVACVDASNLNPIEFVASPAVVLLAATIGNVRLIDNLILRP
jgi:pantoate--beta-alanine ligase